MFNIKCITAVVMLFKSLFLISLFEMNTKFWKTFKIFGKRFLRRPSEKYCVAVDSSQSAFVFLTMEPLDVTDGQLCVKNPDSLTVSIRLKLCTRQKSVSHRVKVSPPHGRDTSASTTVPLCYTSAPSCSLLVDATDGQFYYNKDYTTAP